MGLSHINTLQHVGHYIHYIRQTNLFSQTYKDAMLTLY
jgi:superfamily II DNA/RNA helicase